MRLVACCLCLAPVWGSFNVSAGLNVLFQQDVSPVIACSHSVHIVTQQSCAKLCERYCGVADSSPDVWGLTEDHLECLQSVLQECAVPSGRIVSLVPDLAESRWSHTDIWDYDRFYDHWNNRDRGSPRPDSTRLKYHTFQQVLKFSRHTWLEAIPDPRRLLWATFRVKGPELVGDDRACSHAGILFHQPGTGASSMDDWRFELRGMNLGPRRDGPWEVHVGNRVDIGIGSEGTERYTPSIAALLHQWMLATAHGNRDLVVTLILHQEADLHKARTPNWDDYTITLEVMTSVDWKTTATNPACVTKNTCGDCVRDLSCHWCDLSNVVPGTPDSFFLGARSESTCGISPLTCHYLGGAAYHTKCPTTWDAAWEV
eukprot:Protomagalhaensia_wolfi_Nauph_80__659@NODE_1376_length_1557_cov_178_899868_g1064_i0_p1_GENE_NODE_1376_length_1557_cov_178_899868_g1064_i0NODE_1376_length_1557_cov_178_899868_g1064_i0_p1_ORF_typecomplete_len372_score28_95_NODE_1376_length_1557_cov_178_899868_g1064_i01631278